MRFRLSPCLLLLALAVPSFGADERARTAVDGEIARVIAAGDAGPLLDPVSLEAWRAWAGTHADLGADAGGGGSFASMTSGVRAWRRAGAFTIYESHLIPFPRREWAKKEGLYATRADGFTPNMASWPIPDLPHADLYLTQTADTTQEGTYRYVRDRMNEAFDAGFDSFLIIDYAWPYFEGRWGCGAAAMAQWKAYLKGAGPRIDLAGPDESWDFAAYWGRFSSLSLVPATFGWDTWDDFRYGGGVGTFAARRLLLFDALWHFHHLAFADRLGREAQARGRELALSLNAEDRANGGDYALFGRLRHLGSMGIEFFGGPGAFPALRHTLEPLRWRLGKVPHVDLIGEIGPNGHGPSLMDRDASTVFFYEAAASCLPRFYNAQYIEGPWPEREKLDPPRRERFDAWAAGAVAFLLRHAEEKKAAPSRPEVTVVASRSILEEVAGSSHLLTQEGNLAPYLDALHVDFAQVGRDAWNGAVDEHSRVVVYCPAQATREQLKGVREWLAKGKGKTLVVVGGSPWRSDREGETDPALFPLAGQREAGLSLDGVWLRAWWWDAAVDGRKVLLADEAGVPLLTGWKEGDNRVLHLNADLPVSAPLSPLGLGVVRAALERAKIASYAPYQPDWIVDRYEVPGGAVAAAWNRLLFTQQEAKGRIARTPLAAPGEVILAAPPGAPLRLYSVLDDKVWLQAADEEGKLHVAAPASPLLLYYGAETPAMRETIARARAAFHPGN